MKHSIDDVSNTMLLANKKRTLRSNPTTPREQRRDRRDRVGKEQNKVREKDSIIDQKQAKKRERGEEVETIKEVQSYATKKPKMSIGESYKLSNKLLKAVDGAEYKKPSSLKMPAAIRLGMQQPDVIGVAETGSGKSLVGSKLGNKILKAAAAIRLGLQQPDVIGVAETGSSKAAAFIPRKPKTRSEKFRFDWGTF